jgi:hypothetical protein
MQMKASNNAGAAAPEAASFHPENFLSANRMQKRVPSVTCSPIRHEALSGGKQPKTVKYGGNFEGGKVAGTTNNN